MSTRPSIKFIKAAMSTREQDGKSFPVLRGLIDPDSLHLLQTAGYQREILPRQTMQSLLKPIKEGKVPDICLGVRGLSVNSRDGAFYVSAPTFVIDGLQRVNAATHIKNTEGGTPTLGCLVYFGTDEVFERRLFIDLNTTGLKLSPNVILRDLAPDYPAVADLRSLSETSKGFALYDRVCWDQRMARTHFVSARSFAVVVGHLHSRFAPGKSTDIRDIAAGVQKIADGITSKQVTDNTTTFFELVNECYGLRHILHKERATQIKLNFLLSLARIFSSFDEFWEHPTKTAERANGPRTRLVISKQRREKLRSFQLDNEVARLASSAGNALVLLYMMMLEHLNKNAKSKRLVDSAMSDLRPGDDAAAE